MSPAKVNTSDQITLSSALIGLKVPWKLYLRVPGAARLDVPLRVQFCLEAEGLGQPGKTVGEVHTSAEAIDADL
jgi:hypothetical protein